MKLLLKIDVIASEKAKTMNDSKEMVDKLTKDGQPVFNLYYEVDSVRKVGEKEFKEKKVERISSLIDLKEGSYLLEAEQFIIQNKAYYRAIKKAS